MARKIEVELSEGEAMYIVGFVQDRYREAVGLLGSSTEAEFEVRKKEILRLQSILEKFVESSFYG